MASSIYFPPNQALDSNGDPASGAKAYFYDTGTTSLQTVYADSGLATAHHSPLVADSTGHFAAVYSSGSTDLKVNVTDSADAQLDGYPIDPAIFQSAGAGASTIAFSPTARISATDVQAAIEEVDASVEAIEDEQTIEKSVYTTAGTTTAYTIAVSGVTAYASGDRYWVRANATNTAACTLNVEGVGAKSISKYNNSGVLQDASKGEFIIGSEYLLHYDGTQFVIISSREPYAIISSGTWTPSVNTVTSGPTVGAAPTYAGTYTRLGNIVTAHFEIFYDDAGTNIAVDDRVTMSGLPFASVNSVIASAGQGVFHTSIGAGNMAFCDMLVASGDVFFYYYVTHIDGVVNYGETLAGTLVYEAAP